MHLYEVGTCQILAGIPMYLSSYGCTGLLVIVTHAWASPNYFIDFAPLPAPVMLHIFPEAWYQTEPSAPTFLLAGKIHG